VVPVCSRVYAGRGYGFLKNSHVRIDFISTKLSSRARNWIDIIGILIVLVPFCSIGIWLGWPFFWQAFNSGEMSQNAGGLIRWPAYVLIPLGFGLLVDARHLRTDQTRGLHPESGSGCVER
jgi:TRAP-type mannitol/chloroaromatic compound transport system permease small subunit